MQTAQIEKKLLYKFQAKLEQMLAAYFSFNSIDHSQQKEIVGSEQLVDDIDAIDFMNFKYRTALISTAQDITEIEQQLEHEESLIEEEKNLIKETQEQLHLTRNVINKNKAKYQSLAKKIVAFGKPEKLENSVEEIRTSLEETEAEYQRDMEYYNQKERLLRTSLSALKSFLKKNKPRIDTPAYIDSKSARGFPMRPRQTGPIDY